MLRSVVLVAAACSLCFPASATPPSPMLAKAKSLIGAHMVDPSSLQFRNLRLIHQTVLGKAMTIACGEYNAKNHFGGYAGFQPFAYEPTELKGVMTYGGDSVSFFGLDGGDETSHPEAFQNAETNGRILSACLGLKE